MAFAATTSSLTTAQAHCPSDDNIRHGTMTRYGLCTGFKNVLDCRHNMCNSM
jgi:hypothetical protein